MSKIIDSIIGHAIGDAMGVPIEFEPRKRLFDHPVTKMIGYGSHDVPAGTWSDDTSMEIATIDSFINKGCFDCKDIMMNFYYWLKENKFTAEMTLFDSDSGIGKILLSDGLKQIFEQKRLNSFSVKNLYENRL